MRLRLMASLVVVGLVLFAGPDAGADPIEGSIGFGGDWRPLNMGAPVVDITTADQVDVLGDDAVVTTAIDDLAGLLGSTVTYNDLVMVPFAPVAPLWSGGGFSFDLNSLVIDEQDSDHLDMKGLGVLKSAGFDDTPAAWSFSGDFSGGVFAFSATTTTEIPSVPEPTTLMLLGIGLVAVGGALRRRRG